ncbi:MAG: hypothetical protein JXA33_20495, partial [Anaerolineae bacterium]|nr:hypothetical protein [Anaerolineae bacterium]
YRYELDGLGNATRVTETLADAGYNRVEYVRQSAGNCDQCCTYHDNSQSVATQDLASLPPHRNAKAQKLPS